VLQRVAACCSVMQRVAACCSEEKMDAGVPTDDGGGSHCHDSFEYREMAHSFDGDMTHSHV